MAKRVTQIEGTPVVEDVTWNFVSTIKETLNTQKIKGELSKMSLSDLMVYKDMAEIVYGYYSNMSQATVGGYTDFTLKDHDTYEAERVKYLKIKDLVFEEIKSRVDAIC